MTERKSRIIIAFILMALILAFTYLSVRIIFFIIADNPWNQKILAFILLCAELFGLTHSFGYFLNVIKVMKKKEGNIASTAPPPLTSFPPVAILIPSYKEPLSVIYDTLICCYNLTYPNKQLYLLDDTRYDKPWDTPENISSYRRSIDELCEKLGVNLFRRKWRGAKAGIINDFLRFLEGEKPENLDCHYFQKSSQTEKPKYFVVFDADMNPFPDFVEPLVSHMEIDQKIAFIQTPQYYSNFEMNKVARSAGFQQTVFFEYICEGKGLDNMIFCCGTNVLIRREALASVGGFDESCVTEDIATSFKMHLDGWKSLYYNKISAFGKGPEDLDAYFKQQFRWALGTISLSKKFLFSLLKNYRKKPSLTFWWEYFLSFTHFFVGWVYFFMIAFPIIYLFFSVPIFFMNVTIYFAVFFPYLALTLAMIFWSFYERNFLPKQVFTSMLLTTVTFPVYMRAATYGMLGIKSTFVVTPKEKSSSSLPLRSLWPQILGMALCISAITWGLERIYFENDEVLGLVGNMVWCLYNLGILSTIFYFNDPDIS